MTAPGRADLRPRLAPMLLACSAGRARPPVRAELAAWLEWRSLGDSIGVAKVTISAVALICLALAACGGGGGGGDKTLKGDGFSFTYPGTGRTLTLTRSSASRRRRRPSVQKQAPTSCWLAPDAKMSR